MKWFFQIIYTSKIIFFIITSIVVYSILYIRSISWIKNDKILTSGIQFEFWPVATWRMYNSNINLVALKRLIIGVCDKFSCKIYRTKCSSMKKLYSSIGKILRQWINVSKYTAAKMKGKVSILFDYLKRKCQIMHRAVNKFSCFAYLIGIRDSNCHTVFQVNWNLNFSQG